MHKGAATLHRRRSLADGHASLRRGTHLNDAHALRLHQFRATLRITDVAHHRAAARTSRTSSRNYDMACALQYISGKSCGISPAGGNRRP